MGLRDFTLFDIVERNARLHPNRLAFALDGERVTHAAYRERAERLARGLARAGIGPGDRVVIVSQNNLEFVDLYGAVARLGAILVPVNWRLSAEEVAYVVADAAPKILIADAANQPLLQARPGQPADGRALVRNRRPSGSLYALRRFACRHRRVVVAGAAFRGRCRPGHDPYGCGRRTAARRTALACQSDREQRPASCATGRSRRTT